MAAFMSSTLARKMLSTLLLFLLFAVSSRPVQSSPTPSTKTKDTASWPSVPNASDDPNARLWEPDSHIQPKPIRESLGADVMGPENVPLQLQNADLLAPPTTDHGDIANAKWSFDLSHNRLQPGGWARQQNLKELPIATNIAAVDMRLKKGAIRELHWHKTAEWAYVLKGTAQISTVNADGQNYVKNVSKGSLWYFPAGQPHSIQATGDDEDGVEFLLVFGDGNFSEDDTFLLTDWLAHTPKEVIAKNFHAKQSAFDQIPGQELYIFPGTAPTSDTAPESPNGAPPEPYSYDFANMAPTRYSGGTVKIADSRNFKVAKEIAVAEVSVERNSMRELHWHPTEDEWTYILEGNARITLFGSSGNARTFDYQPGDIAYIPSSFGHYIENTGPDTLRVLEILKTDIFRDISLNQWLALTPPELVKAHLRLSDETIAQLSKEKAVIVAPQP